MNARNVPTEQESPSQVLRRLEITLIWLWSTEPECSVEERQTLLSRLNAVSPRIERLGLRHDARPDDYVDVAELIVCKTELDALCSRWLDPSDVTIDEPLIHSSSSRERAGVST